ncbi:MAG: LysR family transcriptional regulator, partial [Hyphomicrobiales bacterium]|nr:LysR family transcriptional regulator [Hyphomicrobiales bacterium]
MKHTTINWDHYRSFLAVIDCQSLSAAARVLGLSQPTVGRHIDALELAVDAPLFVRSRYGLSPTETAMNMVPHAKTMASAASAIRRASSRDAETSGTIRLTASEVVGVE